MLLLLVLAVQANAQQQECLLVQFDKSFYVSGETIWFKAYLLNDSIQAKSRVLYVDLVNHKNETITQQKLLIHNRSSNGSITLPTVSEEGFYRFRAYTRYNLNFKSAFIYEKIIPIYQPTNQDFIRSDQPENQNISMPDNRVISIVSDKEIYRPRDSLKVSIQINGSNNSDRGGKYSVSVVPVGMASIEFETHNHKVCSDSSFNKEQLSNPERSLFLDGRLQDTETKQPVTSKLITVYMNNASQLIKAFSVDGKIKMPVYDYWGPEIFQILNLDPYSPTDFEFLPERASNSMPVYFHSDPPVRTPVVKKYMEQLQRRTKIAELFELYKFPEVNYVPVSDMIPDAVYRTEDYQGIYSIEDFINEAIPNVRVRTNNGFQTVRLFNKEEGDLFKEHPWYMVDGFLTFNEREILDIQYQDIIEVRLYSKTSTIREYFKHFMWRSGVMEIITRDVKYTRKLKNNPNVAEIDGFSSPQEFSSILILPESKSIPDLRGVIYWSPNVYINDQGQGQIAIPLSDDTGKFSIVMMGTNNLHQAVTGYSTFEIKME